MVATTELTGTVSPSLTEIAVSTPAAGEGISASTLSVEISNSGSSRSTVSPTFLIQRTIVPSAIDSPICGITTSVGIKNLQLVCWRFGELVNSDSVILQFSNSPIHQFTNSNMYGRAVNRVRSLADGLRHRRMRVNRANQILDRRLQAKRCSGFGDQLRRARADHVHAEQLVVLLVRDDLDEPIGLARHLRASKHPEREGPDAHVVAALPGFGFRQPDAPDLWVAVRAAGHVIVVQQRHVTSRNPLRDEDAFRRRHVCELGVRWTAVERDDVADGRHARNVRSILPVDGDEALVQTQTNPLGVQPLRHRAAAGGHEQVVGTNVLFRAISKLNVHVDA